MSWLHRAIVQLPEVLVGRTLRERVVFFDTPAYTTPPGEYIEQLLATLWNVKPEDLDQCIYNVDSERELLDNRGYAPKGDDLNLICVGSGGSDGVGPDRLLLETADRIDLFVSPRHAARIHKALERAELMRLAQERGSIDSKSPATVVHAAKDEICAAVVATKLNGDGPILQVKLRRPYQGEAEEVLVDGAKLSPATVRALKQLKVPVVRRARSTKPTEVPA